MSQFNWCDWELWSCHSFSVCVVFEPSLSSNVLFFCAVYGVNVTQLVILGIWLKINVEIKFLQNAVPLCHSLPVVHIKIQWKVKYYLSAGRSILVKPCSRSWVWWPRAQFFPILSDRLANGLLFHCMVLLWKQLRCWILIKAVQIWNTCTCTC